jgi:hypothetical protein
MNVKIGTLLLPLVIANLIPAVMHKTPVAIQIISRTSSELFLIPDSDCCSLLKDPSFVEMRI